jgi:hypothetical protein
MYMGVVRAQRCVDTVSGATADIAHQVKSRADW